MPAADGELMLDTTINQPISWIVEPLGREWADVDPLPHDAYPGEDSRGWDPVPAGNRRAGGYEGNMRAATR